QAPDAPGFKLDPRVVAAFGRFAGGYWQGQTKFGAWLLTLALAACLILSTGATVALNHWNRWFFDSLEARDVDSITRAVLVFAVIIAAMAAIGVGIVLTRETLQVRWRAWLVEHLLDRWLGRQRFYHLNVTGKEPPNPEYRISDDTRWATEPLVDLRFGMMRIRDNAESVALMNGARYERAILGRFYGTVVARWMAIVWQHGHLTWITNSVGPMKPIIPLLFCAPKYLSGDLTLGQVTQLAAAFVEVQIAISW